MTSGKLLGQCNIGTRVNVNIKGETRNKMNLYWGSLKDTNQGFWDHEYNKHGDCYTKRYNLPNEQQYFDDTMYTYEYYELHKLMEDAVGDSATRRSNKMKFNFDELRRVIQNAREDLYFQLRCRWDRDETKQYLYEIHLFFDIDMYPMFHRVDSNCDRTQPIHVTFDK
jgi:hypothetical protein